MPVQRKTTSTKKKSTKKKSTKKKSTKKKSRSSPIATSISATAISRIDVERLFGIYNYSLSMHEEKAYDGTRFAIIYGDNGAGKTTILKLIFCILSPIAQRGDKTYVAQTPFKSIEIHFNDGSLVSVTRSGSNLVGNYSLRIRRPKQRLYSVELIASEENAILMDTNPRTVELHNRLSDFNVPIYFLPDDRQAKTFENENIYERQVNEEMFLGSSASRFITEMRDRERTHHLNISPVLSQVWEWIRNKAISGSYEGEESANSIYLSLIESVSKARRYSKATTLSSAGIKKLESRLIAIAERSDEYSNYGFAIGFPVRKFISALKNTPRRDRLTIETVLNLRVDGIEARLDALNETMDVLSTFIDTVNSFFMNKKLLFTLNKGFVICDRTGNNIDPNMLSSGEKQLLLLLCNTLLVREQATIFLIDEPELSLNIKWQRLLLDALVKNSKGSNVQYIMATHSMEVLTKHRKHVVQLISK